MSGFIRGMADIDLAEPPDDRLMGKKQDTWLQMKPNRRNEEVAKTQKDRRGSKKRLTLQPG